MKMSKLFVQTLREFPSDAEVISHKLLVRAGFIRKLTSGVYNYLPLMKRVLSKIENIVRQEMDKAGAQELLMPFVQPKELWEESGRWEVYGKELMRLKDRHDRQMCLGPTHEEIITSIAREGLKSYKQLPVNLYQIQSKFRDEVRPRFGLLRGREFIMKDAYSFASSEADLDIEYENMAQAYKQIFSRCGLETKMVQSDSGAIGGSVSHEFMVITDTDAGENDVFYCKSCDYSANSNHAVSILPITSTSGNFSAPEIVDTPDTKTIEQLCEFLNIDSTCILKTLVYIVDKKPVLALIRADRQIEETKLMNALNATDIRIASSAEIDELITNCGFSAKAGFIGPVMNNNNTFQSNEIKIIADNTVKDLKNFVVGINQTDKHLVGANWDTDNAGIKLITPDLFEDIRLVEKDDLCPICKKPLHVTRGIEVGNIFKLGTKYSKPMNAVYTDVEGNLNPYIMGCYGIGISRTAAAAVEAHHDEFGIKWPASIAPYHVIIIPSDLKNEQIKNVAFDLYEKLLNTNIEVVIDDRDERPGVKFKDADLIGFPLRVTVGRSLAEGNLELKLRHNGEIKIISVDETFDFIKNYFAELI